MCDGRAWRIHCRVIDGSTGAATRGSSIMVFPQGGGCQCGRVRYEISGPPSVVYTCHCTECQRQSGAAFAMAAVIPQQHFRITTGEPRMFLRRTSPVKTMECWFCAD